MPIDDQFYVFEFLADLGFDFVGQLRVVLEQRLDGVAALRQAGVAVAEPGAALLDHFQFDAQVDDLADVRDAFAEDDVELGLLERRGHLVLDDLGAGAVAGGFVAVLDLGDAAHVDAHRGVELQGVAARGGLGVAEEDADLLAELVDEDAAGIGLGNVGREFAEGLAHQAGLEAHFVVAHLAFDLGFRRQGRHGVDDDDVDGAAADQVVGDFKGLLAVVGLGNEQRVDVHAQVDGVGAVEGVLGVDDGGDAALLLRLGDGVDGQRGLAAGFRAVDFNDAAARIAADAQRVVERDRARRDGGNLQGRLISHLHDGAFAEILFDLGDGRLKRLELLGVLTGTRIVHFFIFFCHTWLVLRVNTSQTLSSYLRKDTIFVGMCADLS